MRYTIRYFRAEGRFSFLMTRGGLELPTELFTYSDFDSARAGAFSTLAAITRSRKDYTFSLDENPNPRNILRGPRKSPIHFDSTHSNFYRPLPARVASPASKRIPLVLSELDY